MALPESTRKLAKEKAYARYYSLKFNVNTDADIIKHLGNQANFQGYIKKLIRDDMERGKQ